MKIRVLRPNPPSPHLKEPPGFMREAFVGLELEPSWKFLSGEDDLFPEGAYMVPMGQVVRKMAAHNYRAYQYLCASWGQLMEFDEEYGMGIPMPFSFTSCEVIS